MLMTPQNHRQIRRFVAVSGAVLLLGACASSRPLQMRSYSVPASVHSVYVGTFGSNAFGREMRDAVIEQLQKSPRFTLATSVDSADAQLDGAFSVVTPNTSLQRSSPMGVVALAERASQQVVWRYEYRDESTGAEMAKPTQLQQVRVMARQFVEQLLRVSAPVVTAAQ